MAKYVLKVNGMQLCVVSRCETLSKPSVLNCFRHGRNLSLSPD
ncbi:MAG: hypothetical protein G01um101420_345, partial [Parcubacteria group bacterium Gr01-1014_20]